jgi:DNA-binding transcriptional ArsR family regulator
MEIKQAVRAMSALAQESRLETFRLLVTCGETGMPAGQIAEYLDIPAATLSFHLKELSNADLARISHQVRAHWRWRGCALDCSERGPVACGYRRRVGALSEWIRLQSRFRLHNGGVRANRERGWTFLQHSWGLMMKN